MSMIDMKARRCRTCPVLAIKGNAMHKVYTCRMRGAGKVESYCQSFYIKIIPCPSKALPLLATTSNETGTVTSLSGPTEI